MTAGVIAEPDIHRGHLVLVNRQYPYSGRVPPLVPVQEEKPAVFMEHRAAASLSGLMAAMHGWRQITAVSGWRSLQEQQDIWDQSLSENGPAFTQTYVAVPGHSEHQTGLAIDLALKSPAIDRICPDFPYEGICQTFRENAAAFGFVERYPAGKESVTGIGHEPWHFRYVGVPHAQIMTAMGLTLEEYHALLRRFPYGRPPFVYACGERVFEIAYLPAQDGDILWEAPPVPYTISGNNMDGCIVTKWKD